MGCGEIATVAHDARGSLTDRGQIENDCLLGASIVEEVGLDGVLDVFTRQPCRFQHMREVVDFSALGRIPEC